MIPACDRHQRLVDQVASGEATDAELLSYADEVTACGACQQVLAVATRTHPAVIVQGGTESAEVGWQAVAPDAGMARLSEALQAADSGPRDGAMRWRVALGVGLAAAALAAVVLRTVDPAPPTAPSVTPAPERTPVAEAVVTPRPAIVPVPVAPAEAPLPEALDPSDAVAMVDGDDWEPPPWQDLRSGLKAAPGTLSVTLSLSQTAPALGEVVNLTLNSTAPTPVTVCVRGVESGVVWRGDVPQGRVPLTLDGAALAYQFASPGRYAFAVSLGDDPRCVDPVQRLTVGVP